MKVITTIKQNTAPNPLEHDYWIDTKSDPTGGIIKRFKNGKWEQIECSETDLQDYLKKTEADSKYQKTLVSNQNIKTINGLTILGSGNISIPKGDTGLSVTAITLTKSAEGIITGGKATMSDGSSIDITVSEAA